MNWLHDYEDELREVFAEAGRRIALFPAPLDERGAAYLRQFHPLEKESAKNYICYLLPYWLKPLTKQNDVHCRQMALANVFVMLYFFIQDDLMDTPPAQWSEQLALANLLHVRLLEVYRPLFAADSPFWSYYRQYVTEWAAGVTSERGRDDFPDHPERLAHKASPVKLASTGLLLLGGRPEAIPRVSELVDQVLITLQMADDRADWRDDLREGNANSLLSFIRGELGWGERRELDEREVRTSVYVRGSLQRFARLAEDRHRRLRNGETGAPHLLDFHEFVTNGLLSHAAETRRNKDLLLMGGFAYWLSKNTK